MIGSILARVVGVLFVVFVFVVIVVVVTARLFGSRFTAGGFSGFFALIVEQGLTVRLGQLVIIWVDFVKGKETVAVSAVIDEGGLERWFNTGNFGKVDVAAKLFSQC